MRARETFLIALWSTVLLSASSECKASFIRLRVTPGCSFHNEHLVVSLSVQNKGDEDVHEIQVEAVLNDTRGESAVYPLLETNRTFSTTVEMPLPSLDPGIHTVILKTRYMDRSGHPFTTLTTLPLATDIPASRVDPLKIYLPDLTMKSTGAVTLTVTNSTAADIEASLHIVAPDELLCDRPVRQLTVPAHSHLEESFRIHNLYALRNSRYVVSAIVDYKSEALHRSSSASSLIRISPRRSLLSTYRGHMVVLLLLLVVLCIVLELQQPSRCSLPALSGALSSFSKLAFTPLILLIITGILIFHLHPAGLLSDTMAVGGDTPAHNYLASQLKSQLLESGRIIGSSPGWWCGFPLFQFYFCLPYLLIAALSSLLPFNIAFKLVSVSGILFLPAAAFMAGRRMRLSSPLPVLLSIFTLPLLFDTTHTMWGVNIYSTLAGMISNSLSFAVMLLFVASASRDCDDGEFRIRSALLYALLISSHFFTTVIASLTLLLLPFLGPRRHFLRSVRILASESLLGALLMAWWLVPLVAKRAYGVDFGVNWAMNYRRLFSAPIVIGILPGVIISVLSLITRPTVKKTSGPDAYRTVPRRLFAATDASTRRFILINGFMLCMAAFLHLFGQRISPVFVNVRLWPFMAYAALALSAAGCSIIIKSLKSPKPAVAAVLMAVLLYGTGKPEEIMRWSEWNYDGLQRKARWPVIRKLLLPLEGTPGRLANDLHSYNESFGSSRIFEATPHLTGKPVLEGGIVNSAAGSLFAYYIQSETSDHCAGFPPIVKPATFNLTHATRHLELFNVKHFIARSERTRHAMDRAPEWKKLREAGGWELYELTTHDGSCVFVPDFEPLPLITDNWKRTALQWIYTTELLDRFFILLDRPEDLPPRIARRPALPVLDGSFGDATGARPPAVPTVPAYSITNEEVSPRRIRFRTNAVGAPHIIKTTWFPNWKVRGADGVYRVTPCFILVYPTDEKVELYYGYTISDTLGHLLAIAGVVMLGVMTMKRYRR